MTTTRLRVNTASPYDVVIGSGVYGELADLLGSDVQRVGIIFSEAVEQQARVLHAALTNAGYDVHLVAVPESEAAKQADVAAFCWKVLGHLAEHLPAERSHVGLLRRLAFGNGNKVNVITGVGERCMQHAGLLLDSFGEDDPDALHV